MTNQLEVVAYHQYARKKPDERSLSFLKALPSILRNTGWVSEPLVRQSDALEVIAELEKDVLANAKDAARYRLVCLLDNTIDAQIERVQGGGK